MTDLIIDQPPPRPNDGPSVQAMVRADLVERERVGRERYGTSLQPVNGRDALVDAYQEALDLACYIRQELAERDEAPSLALRLAAAEQTIRRQHDLIAEMRRQMVGLRRLAGDF